MENYMRKSLFKIIRITAIVLMGLTVAFTLLGGIGSTCAAFLTENFASLGPLIPYKWLYQVLVIISVAAGLFGTRALIGLIKGKPQAYRDTLVVLIVGGASALIQMVASRTLRGASMPTDVRLYITTLTLVVFLLLRLPGVWHRVNFTHQMGNLSGTGGGMTAISLGLAALTVHLWAGPSHTFNGLNYANIWNLPLTAAGWILAITGIALIVISAAGDSIGETPVISKQPEPSGSIKL
jgi:hypothetical protein